MQCMNLSMKHEVKQTKYLACNTNTSQTLAWTATTKPNWQSHNLILNYDAIQILTSVQSVNIKIYCTLKEANSNEVMKQNNFQFLSILNMYLYSSLGHFSNTKKLTSFSLWPARNQHCNVQSLCRLWILHLYNRFDVCGKSSRVFHSLES